MKKCMVFLNGFTKCDIEAFKLIDFHEYDLFCCDGGANLAYTLSVIPKLILGDMDSISHEAQTYFQENHVRFKVYDPIKDFSDGEILFEILSKKYHTITVVGGVGKRLDHSLVNIFLLEKYPKLTFITATEILNLCEKTLKIDSYVGKTVSILPLTDTANVSTQGFFYELDSEELSRGSSRGLSNIINLDKAKISVNHGKVLVIINRGELE